MAMLTRLGAVVFMTPMFLIPGFFVGLFGGWVGRIYMAAQLSVKREMSNAKAPVVGQLVEIPLALLYFADSRHSFGAAISGLST